MEGQTNSWYMHINAEEVTMTHRGRKPNGRRLEGLWGAACWLDLSTWSSRLLIASSRNRTRTGNSSMAGLQQQSTMRNFKQVTNRNNCSIISTVQENQNILWVLRFDPLHRNTIPPPLALLANSKKKPNSWNMYNRCNYRWCIYLQYTQSNPLA